MLLRGYVVYVTVSMVVTMAIVLIAGRIDLVVIGLPFLVLCLLLMRVTSGR
jgi:hypothetical protein